MIYLTLFQSFDYYSKSIYPIEYILIEHSSFAVNFCCPLALVFFLLSYNLHANRALRSGLSLCLCLRLCLGSLLTALCADGQRVVWPLRVIIGIIIVVVAVVVFVVIGGVCFILTSFGCAWALLAFAVN